MGGKIKNYGSFSSRIRCEKWTKKLSQKTEWKKSLWKPTRMWECNTKTFRLH